MYVIRTVWRMVQTYRYGLPGTECSIPRPSFLHHRHGLLPKEDPISIIFAESNEIGRNGDQQIALTPDPSAGRPWFAGLIIKFCGTDLTVMDGFHGTRSCTRERLLCLQ
jgi:hypothetical protein